MTHDPARDNVGWGYSEVYNHAAVAAVSAIALSLASHNVPTVPSTLAAALFKALGVVSIRGKTYFHSTN